MTLSTFCRLVLLGVGLSSAVGAQAQRRAVNAVALLPTVQAEYALRGDDYLLLGLNGPISTGSYNGTGLDRVGLRLGYEHFWNTRWSGGGTLGIDTYKQAHLFGGHGDQFRTDVAPEVFARHWNTLGSFNFRQRLGVSYFVPGATGADSRALTSLRLDLDRLVPVGGGRVVLRPRLAYEAIAYLRFQRDEATQPKERVIDFGYARAEVGVRLSDRFDFTPWFGYQTTYVFALAQTNPMGQVTTTAGRLNLVTPVVGLDARFTLFRGKAAFERRQLPTQH